MDTETAILETPVKHETEFSSGKPGVYFDVPAEEYHAFDACSKSAMDWLADFSPMHLEYRRKNPEEPTDALRFGSALHTAILERDKFEESYLISDRCSAVKKDGAQCGNEGIIYFNGTWLCGVHGKGTSNQASMAKVITREWKESIDNIARAVSFHKGARWILEQPGNNEVSVLWEQPLRGISDTDNLPCKLRADGVRPDVETILDVKTTECASQSEFEKSIAEYGYHRQSALYQDGLAARGIKIKHFVFIVVEKKAPYGVATYRILDDAIQAGREENSRLLEIYGNCKAANYWPGYADVFQDVSLPRWKFQQIIGARV